jgi:hypothetical protein
MPSQKKVDLDISPSEVEGTAFSGAEYDAAYPDGYENHFWHLARAEIILDALKRYVPRSSVILEVGCGRGLYVAKARQADFAAFGCDLGRPRVHDSVADVVQTGKDFRDLDPSLLAKVSAVLLLDVLEHLEEPEAILKQLSDAMPALQTIVATVPARKELWSNYDEHYGHFRRYSRSELDDLYRSAGYQPVESRYFFRFLYLPMWIQANIQRKRAVEIQRPGNAWLHKALGVFGVIEARLLPRSMWGTSIIGIAQKR